MSTRFREALTDLEQDVRQLRLAPPHVVRARADSTRRRRAATAAVAAGAAVVGLVTLPWPFSASPEHRAGTAPSSTACPVVSPSDGVRSPFRVTVFLASERTAEQTSAIDVKLRTLPSVAEVRFESRSEAWRRFRSLYCDSPELVALTNPDSLPESFRVTLVDPAGYADLERELAAMPGVDTVYRAPWGY